MVTSMSAKWMMTFACVLGISTGGVAFGHGGHGGGGHGGGHGGHGGGHHGGHYGGHHGGHYGGHYGGYRGYGYGGYGYGGYGVGLGYGRYYGYPGYSYGWNNTYYSPQYYNSVQPIYTNPGVTQAVYANSMIPGNGPVTLATQSPFDNGQIVLFSPASNTRETRYWLNGMPYVMRPGTVQRFRNDRTWTIEIKSTDQQILRYTLSTGNFKMKESATGMELFSTADQP